ncbi:MAG: 50S ribosomal protein L11 methyltransferase [Vicinamibacterales bacterium]
MGRHPALDLTFAPGPGAGTLQDMLYAELDTFEPVAIQEHDAGDGWRVFFRSSADRDAATGALRSEFGNALIRAVAIDVDDEDWARRSQATLTAVRVGRIVVAPPWDRIANPAASARQPQASSSDSGSGVTNSVTYDRGSRTTDPDPITIVIDPSTGFGTGHHASTRLCLELLQRRDLHGERVIDVGTGSGVLALAASKLGATCVVAIDNDPDALENARDNVIRNMGAKAITIREMDFTTAALEPADLVIANLTGAILQRHAAALRRLVAADGTLIVSGFTREEEADVARAFGDAAQQTAREGEWVALMF